METKFKDGQRVRSKKFGDGVVEDFWEHCSWPINVRMTDGYCRSFKLGGEHQSDPSEIDLFPIDPPRTLTEWQMIKLRDHFLRGYKLASEGIDWYSLADDNLNAIESILAQQEPEKYQPKQGEAVIYRDAKDKPWSAAVACGLRNRVYWFGDILDAFELRPLDPDLVGKVTE